MLFDLGLYHDKIGKVKFCAHSALWTSLGFGSNIVGMIRNYTFYTVVSGRPGVFKERLDIVLRDMVKWELLVIGERLDWMIFQAFSSLGDSMILGLRLNNYSGISVRDLPQGEKALHGRGCGTVWAAAWSGGHPQGFGTSSPSNCRILRNW